MNNLELIQEAINTLQPLFEVGGPDEVPASTNKIIKTKKDKKGEPTDVVSVADELFPKEGSAKEQFHQKVIDKINDMIQGTATLEDLLQLVTRKQAAKKQVHEGLEEFGDKISLLEKVLIESLTAMTQKHKPELESKAIGLSSHNMSNQKEIIKKNPKHYQAKGHSQYPKTSKGRVNPQDYIGHLKGEKEAIEQGATKSTLRSIAKHGSEKAIEGTGKKLIEIGKEIEKSDNKEGLKDFTQNIKNYTQFVKNRIAKERKALSEELEEFGDKINLLEELINETSDKLAWGTTVARMKNRAANPNDVEAEKKMDKNAELMLARSARKETNLEAPIRQAVTRHGINVKAEKKNPSKKNEDRTIESGETLKKIGKALNDMEKHGTKGQNVVSKIKTINKKGKKEFTKDMFESFENNLSVLEELINELHITDNALKTKISKSWQKHKVADAKHGKAYDQVLDKYYKLDDEARKSGNKEFFKQKPGESDTEWQARKVPQEASVASKHATESNRQLDRYLRGVERYNKRHPEKPIQNNAKELGYGQQKSGNKMYAEHGGVYRTNVYKKPSDHIGNHPEPERVKKVSDS